MSKEEDFINDLRAEARSLVEQRNLSKNNRNNE